MPRMRLLIFALGLFFAAATPVVETLDRWDVNPNITADAEFQVAAVSFGVGLAAIAWVASRHVAKIVFWRTLTSPQATVCRVRFGFGDCFSTGYSPPILLPIRI